MINIAYLKDIAEFKNISDEELAQKIKVVESLVRSYTNNNFQNRKVRWIASTFEQNIKSSQKYLKIGDTIQISQSINDGVYRITDILKSNIMVDGILYDASYNLLTKVEYPADVVQGAINILKWEVVNRQKVGIKSESIARHSVTYYDQDNNNQLMGYPISLLGFLKPYKKARF